MKKKKHRPEDDEGGPDEDNGPELPTPPYDKPGPAPEGPPAQPEQQEALEAPKEPLKIQYEDDIVQQQLPEKREIKEDEITPPIILPYEPEHPDPSSPSGAPLDSARGRQDDSAGKPQGDKDTRHSEGASPPCHSEGASATEESSVCHSDPCELIYEVNQQGEESKKQPDFSERQKQLIEYLKQNNQITRKEYADKFNISVPTAARDLKQLLKAGIIVPRGPAATGRYYELK